MAAGSSEELRSAGIRRHRIVITPDAGWLRESAGTRGIDVAGPEAVVEFEDRAAIQDVLEQAVRRGGLRSFSEIVRSLSDIYKQVVR